MPYHVEHVLWVIYDHPKDYPEHFVVRRWTTCGLGAIPDAECQLADSLEEARRKIPLELGLVRLAPQPGEDPCIAETWL